MSNGRQNNTPKFIPFGIIPTQEQIDIQIATFKVLLVEANAGAAKTTTLALRIGETIAHGVNPERILALVFTDTAREVMRRRLIELGVHYSVVDRIAIQTFEEFARKQLAQTEDSEIPYFPNARQHITPMIKAVEAVYSHYGDRAERYELNLDFQTHALAITQYLDAQLKLKAMMELPVSFEMEDLCDVFDRLGVSASEFLVAFEYERIRAGSWSTPKFRGPFDATYDVAKDVDRGSDRLTEFQSYRLVVCDELHDLNEATFRIICDLIERPDCYFVGAGDRDQVIHATLGASHEYLNSRFSQRFPNVKRMPLTVTHRHGSHLAYSMGAFKGKPSESDVPDRFEIKIESYTGEPAECARRVTTSIEKSLREGFRLGGCAILLRDRHHSVEIENALRQAGIGYRTPVMGSYLQREEILFLRGIIAIVLRNFEGVTRKEVKDGIVEALDLYGNLRIPHEKLQDLKKGMAKHSQLHWFYEMAIRSKEGEQPSVLDSTIRYAMDVSPDALAGDVLREICERMNLKKIAEKLYVRPYDAKIVWKSIDGFLSITGVQTLRQFSESINEADRFAIQYRDKDVLTLDCVANSKGKEFDHVILPFVENGEYPNPMFPLVDEENLFYVGATRAKRRLTLVAPEAGEQRSIFIKQMNIGGTRAKANIAQERNEDAFRHGPATRQYLRVPYSDKDRARLLGARWDEVRKKWYVPIGMDLKPFEQWF